MAEAMSFWSVILPPKGQDVEQQVESTESVLTSIHITGASLGATPKPGPHVIILEYNGTNTVLATLESPHTRQYGLDIVVDQTYKVRTLGDSEVHLYGYMIASVARSGESDEDEDEEIDSDFDADEEGMGVSDEDEDEDEEDEGEEDDERVPKGVPLKKKKAAAAAAANGGGDHMDTDGETDEEEEGEDEDEEGEDEDEDDEDIPDLDNLGSEDLVMEADEDEEDEGEEEEGEEEEAAAPTVGAKRPPQTPQPGKPAKQPKQAKPVPQSAPPKQTQPKTQPQPQKGTKQIPVTAAAGGDKPQSVPVKKEQPGKEAKGKAAAPAEQAKGKEAKPAEQAKGKEAKGKDAKGKDSKPAEQAKGAAEAKGKAGAKAPANEAEYRQALVELLKGQKGGPVPLSQIGSAVKKPPGVTKLGEYFKQHADTFEVAGDKVSLKKK